MKRVPSYPDSHVLNQSSVVIVTADYVGPAAPVSLCVRSRPSVNAWDVIGLVWVHRTQPTAQIMIYFFLYLYFILLFLPLHKPERLGCGERTLIRSSAYDDVIGLKQLVSSLQLICLFRTERFLKPDRIIDIYMASICS